MGPRLSNVPVYSDKNAATRGKEPVIEFGEMPPCVNSVQVAFPPQHPGLKVPPSHPALWILSERRLRKSFFVSHVEGFGRVKP